MWFIIVCYVGLVVAFFVTAISITITDRIKDKAYAQGFDSGYTWGIKSVHIKEYGDLYV